MQWLQNSKLFQIWRVVEIPLKGCLKQFYAVRNSSSHSNVELQESDGLYVPELFFSVLVHPGCTKL